MKHVFQSLLSFRRALHVSHRPDPFGHLEPLRPRNRRQSLLLELGDDVGIVPQVDLVPHQDDGHARTVVRDLRVPLLLDVVEGDGADDGEAGEKDIRLRVGEGAESVVVLLPGRVPQVEADELAVDARVFGIVIKPARD